MVAAAMVAAGMVANMVAAGTVPNMVAAGIVPNMVAAGTGQALSDMAWETVAADTAQALPDTVAAGIWVTRCSAIAPLPTWHCNRNSGMRDSTADSPVRPGPGGVAVSSSAGSDRCSGPTPIMTCSITFTGRMPMTTSGLMPTTTSTTASMALTPITAPMALLAEAAAA